MSRTTSAPRWADLAKAAAYVDVAPRTIRYWTAQGRIPAYRVGPKLVRYDLNDLDNLIQRIPTAG